jgi:tRNA/rRNA methyltransferase
MIQARAMAATGKRVAFLFGPERAGLENDDVARANAIITVPVNPEFFSLNLAQCVLLSAYEWRRQTTEVPDQMLELAGVDFASKIEIEKLGDHFEDRLDEAKFFFPPAKGPGMKVALRNMWGRLPLTRADVQTLHGVLRQLLRKPSE